MTHHFCAAHYVVALNISGLNNHLIDYADMGPPAVVWVVCSSKQPSLVLNRPHCWRKPSQSSCANAIKRQILQFFHWMSMGDFFCQRLRVILLGYGTVIYFRKSQQWNEHKIPKTWTQSPLLSLTRFLYLCLYHTYTHIHTRQHEFAGTAPGANHKYFKCHHSYLYTQQKGENKVHTYVQHVTSSALLAII